MTNVALSEFGFVIAFAVIRHSDFVILRYS